MRLHKKCGRYKKWKLLQLAENDFEDDSGKKRGRPLSVKKMHVLDYHAFPIRGRRVTDVTSLVSSRLTAVITQT